MISDLKLIKYQQYKQYIVLQNRAGSKQQYIDKMENHFQLPKEKNTIRLRVKTNKFINFIVAIEANKTMRELAHRALNCFHELAEQHVSCPPKRRDLTVSALKIDNFFVSKSQTIGNMLKDNDQIQCVFSKAKPKYPNYPLTYDKKLKTYNHDSNHFKTNQPKGAPINKLQAASSIDDKQKSKRQRKKEKKREKQKQKQQLVIMEKPIQHFNSQKNNHFFNFKNQQKQFFEQKNKKIQPQNQKEISFGQQNQKNNSLTNSISTIKEDKINLKNEEEDQNMFANNSLNTTLSYNLKNKQSIEKQKDERQVFDANSNIIKPQQNLTPTSKQIDTGLVLSSSKSKQIPQKKKGNSILDILSKAQDDKQKKQKKKDKRNQKLEESLNQSKSKEKQKSLNNAQDNAATKLVKVEKQILPNNKITSPKVTFHTSPLSPQMFSLNSPKRKSSATPVQKMEKIQLQGPQSKIANSSKEQQKEKKNFNAVKVEPLRQVKKQVKKQIPPVANGIPKIIVEQESQGESPQNGSNQKDEKTTIPPSKQLEHTSNPKIAALDAKISKYRLQFFNDSEDNEDN